MKKLLKSTACILFSAAVLISCNEDDATPVVVNESCFPEALEDGLIASYSFAGGSLEDHVGIADLTVLNAGPAADRGGSEDCAYGFQGAADSYLMTQDTQFLNGLDEMTVSLWYQADTDMHDYELLLGRGDGLRCPDKHGEWALGIYDGRRAVFGHVNSVWEEDSQMENTEWRFVTATVKKSLNTISIYVDGVLQSTETTVADCGTQPVTVDDTGNLYIGRYFHGKIDDITIYNRILTQAEITQLSELAPCCE